MAGRSACWSGRTGRILICASVFVICLTAFFKIAEGQPSSSKNKLEARVNQMLEWSTRRSIITLSSDKLNTYVKSKPRNYSVIVTFTALQPQRKCSVCKDVYDEFTILANSWRYSQQYSSELFFVKVDIDEGGMDAFQQMHLTTAPIYVHFPPTGKRKPEDRYDISRSGYTAEPLGKWVAERTGINISIMRPPNYTLLMIWIPVILLASIVGYLKRENLYMLYDTRYWAVAAMVWIFVMISGQMWNHIRGPPFAHRNPQTGEMGYFSGTSQYQFIAETYFIIVIYAVMALGMILLNERFALLEYYGLQKIAPIIGLSLVVLDFGYLLSIFRMKYQGYPYRCVASCSVEKIEKIEVPMGVVLEGLSIWNTVIIIPIFICVEIIINMHLKDVALKFNISNFSIYCCLLVLSVLLSLQADGVISWSFGVVFIPLWIWKAFTISGAVLGIFFCVKKKRDKEKENFIAMISSAILQFVLLIAEILIAVNLDLNGRLYWLAIFAPLYLLVILSVVALGMSCCYLKRCSVELELLGFINLVQLILIGVRLDGITQWRWAHVLVPTWIVLSVTAGFTMIYACVQCFCIGMEDNQREKELRKTMAATTIIFFSLATVSFALFLALIVSQLDGKLSAPYTGTFVPLHFSILFLFPTTVSRQSSNPLWFGLMNNFVEFLLELVPAFKEYLNVAWGKDNCHEEKQPALEAEPHDIKFKENIPFHNVLRDQYAYVDIMTPD